MFVVNFKSFIKKYSISAFTQFISSLTSWTIHGSSQIAYSALFHLSLLRILALFEEHAPFSNLSLTICTICPQHNSPCFLHQDISTSNGTNDASDGAPNVEMALNMSATDAQKLASQPHKSTIGQRKPASKVSFEIEHLC